MKILRIVVITAAIAVILAVTAYLSAGRIAAYLMEKKYGLDISYAASSVNMPFEIAFTNLTVFSEDSGLGINCAGAVIKPLRSSGKWRIDADLKNARFVRKRAERADKLDTLNAVALIPFSQSFNYSRVKAAIEPGESTVRVIALNAVSDDVDVALDGEFARNIIRSCDITIKLSDAVTGRISPELAAVLFGNDKAPRKTLSVHLSGDYASPQIQVSGKSFRLKISSVRV